MNIRKSYFWIIVTALCSTQYYVSSKETVSSIYYYSFDTNGVISVYARLIIYLPT